MSYSVRTTPNFDREAKRLAKKWPSLGADLKKLFAKLAEEPTTGTSLGGDIYKIRLSRTSLGKGKSGGARVMTYVQVVDKVVYLFSIYHKGERSTLSDREIKELLKEIP
jgi:mRNA-degrading endonuclease RelE of RelBE toxin-antitoxin system